MRHFINTGDYDRATLETILTHAMTHRGRAFNSPEWADRRADVL
jgi:hypothetical protein